MRIKRWLLSAFFIILPALCACGRAEPAATPTDAAATATDAAQSASVVFQLDKLPELGPHRAKTARTFYDAPLKRFEPSEDYGLLIPYRLHSDDMLLGSLGRFGLMTADGRIVTGPIYSEIAVWQMDGKTYYRAACHVFEESATDVPSWQDDPDGFEEVNRQAEDYYRDNVLVQLIPAEGDGCLSIPNADVFPFTDPSTGVTLFVGSSAALGWSGESTDRAFFTVCDGQLEPVAALTEEMKAYDGLNVISADETGCVLCGYTRPTDSPEETEGTYTLLFCEDGKLVDTFSLGSEYPMEAAGGLVRCPTRLCDRDGNTVAAFDEQNTEATYDPQSGCYILLDRKAMTLRKIDRNGDVMAQTRLPSSPSPDLLNRCDFDGQTRLVVTCRLSYAEKSVYRVYDGDLREVCTVGDLNAPAVELTNWYKEKGLHVFTVPGEGTTDLLDLNGSRLASVPFAVTGCRTGEYTHNANLLLLYNNGRYTLYDGADRSLSPAADMPASPENVYCFDRNAMVFYTNSNSPSVNDWRYSFRETATGRVLKDGVDSVFICPVNGEVYYSYLRRGTVHVCDGALHDVATLYDDLYS